MSLAKCPNELIINIFNRLPPSDKYRLSKTSRRLYLLIGDADWDEFYQHNVHEELGDRHRLHRACYRCNYLLPFYHFSRPENDIDRRDEGAHRHRLCLGCTNHELRHQYPTWIFSTSVRVCSACDQWTVTVMHETAPHGRGRECLEPCGYCRNPHSTCQCNINTLRSVLGGEHMDFQASWMIAEFTRLIAGDQAELRAFKRAAFDRPGGHYWALIGDLAAKVENTLAAKERARERARLDPVGAYIKALSRGKGLVWVLDDAPVFEEEDRDEDQEEDEDDEDEDEANWEIA